MSLIDSAVALISSADRQLETAAQNVSNMATPGYRARMAFFTLDDAAAVPAGNDQAALPRLLLRTDFARGNTASTHNAYDLALGNDGFFVIRSGDETRYTRSGEFRREADGRLVAADGFALQSDNGDIVLKGVTMTVLADGTVLDDGEPRGRIQVREFPRDVELTGAGNSAFRVADEMSNEVLNPDVRQGELETSNVSTAHEVMAMMKAMRQAETGQRVVQLYDELLGQAINNFGGAQS